MEGAKKQFEVIDLTNEPDEVDEPTVAREASPVKARVKGEHSTRSRRARPHQRTEAKPVREYVELKMSQKRSLIKTIARQERIGEEIDWIEIAVPYERPPMQLMAIYDCIMEETSGHKVSATHLSHNSRDDQY